MRVLVVDDQPAVQQFLKEVLELHGYEVLTAEDGVKALEHYREFRPSFTLTDISMPGMTGLELLKQIKTLNAEAIVMLMTGAGSETYAIEALRGGAVNYFTKPVDINDLLNTLSRYTPLASGYDFEHYAASFLQEETLNLVLENDLAQVNHGVQMIVNHSRAIFPMSEIYTLRFGLYEMIVNAIEHGNLGITFQEKSRALEENRFGELMRERIGDPRFQDRRVSVDCRISREGLQCDVRDEGEGFDHSVYSSVDDPAALFERLGASLHGRGIILTRLQFDSMQFNEVGNEVRLVKKLTARG
jgi:DNA-binding response OmpR family regulator